jgi:hypothetical protein
MKQNRVVTGVSVLGLAGRPDAWGTDLGMRAFAEFDRRLAHHSEGSFVLIDYSGMDVSDVSFQREAVVEILRKHRPGLLFVATAIEDPDLRANLDLALEKRGESLLVKNEDTAVEVIGKRLHAEQWATLQAVSQAGEMTSAGLRERFDGLELSTAANRLSGLWKAGLVERMAGTAATGGREHRYYPIV